MSFHLKKYHLLLILALLFRQICFAQQGFDNKSRSLYIHDISKYVIWEGEEKTDLFGNYFTIGLLEKDSALYYELIKLSQTKKTLHNKPVDILIFRDISEIQKTQVLYVHKKSGYDIDKILEKTAGNRTLIISENYEFHKSMINFIVVKGERHFELNETKLNAEGMKVKPLFVALAVKTKADWEELYQKTETLLKEEKKVVERQNKEILQQKQEIEAQNEKIKDQKKEIREQQNEIEKQYTEIKIQKQELAKLSEKITIKQQELDNKMQTLVEQENLIKKQTDDIKAQNKIREKQKKEIKDQQKRIETQKNEMNELLKEIQLQKVILGLFIALIIVFAGLGYFIYRAYKIKKQANRELQEKNTKIMAQNEEILQQKEEIETQRDEIEGQRDRLAEQNEEILQSNEEIAAQRDEIEKQKEEIEAQRDLATKQRDEISKQKNEITDSIYYARRIQSAILPPKEFISDILPHHFFILNKPRDIVSGDYYWIAHNSGSTVFAVADCTGHGVPGAFMSMLGVAFLNQIVSVGGHLKANDMLNRLREHIMEALHQTGKEGEAQDGMDIALCILDKKGKKLQYSGANNSLYMIRKGELTEIKADRMPIGIYHLQEQESFTNHVIDLQTNDTIYIFSDGYADQFGGPDRKKFKYGAFKKLLVSIQDKKMKEQSVILDNTIEEWKGELEQIDDILIMGIKI